jgi:glycosyltransferase involved in cell wall biosynthesis
MKIGLFHGYELSGSGSNEYCRYLAKTLVHQNHTVHIICRERKPEELDFLGEAWLWKEDGSKQVLQLNKQWVGKCTLHQIPSGPIYPVYVSDKQRPGNSKSFINLSDQELEEFKQINERALRFIFEQIQLDILHANHMVMQPSVSLAPCKEYKIPLVIFPHGSAIEYTVKKDQRYLDEARHALVGCAGLISGSKEVKNRIGGLYPDLNQKIQEMTQIIGVGVDTTLFTPVTKNHRKGHIEKLVQSDLLDNSTGKSPELVQALYDQLSADNLQVIDQYHASYTDKDLDTDVVDKLKRLDFNQPVLLFVGALTAGKGIQSLLCALSLVFEVSPNTQLLIVGSGAYREVLEALIFALANKDKSLLSKLAEQGFDLDRSDEKGPWQDVLYSIQQTATLDRLFKHGSRLQTQVSFLGRMNHQQLSYVFPCADLAIFPSVIAEAYPLVLMESLANGVLPLVSYFSGFKDGLDELEQFLEEDLVDKLKITMEPEKRITGLAGNIIELIKLIQKEDMSDKLARIAIENYDWEIRAKAMVKAYEVIINKELKKMS